MTLHKREGSHEKRYKTEKVIIYIKLGVLKFDCIVDDLVGE